MKSVYWTLNIIETSNTSNDVQICTFKQGEVPVMYVALRKKLEEGFTLMYASKAVLREQCNCVINI